MVNYFVWVHSFNGLGGQASVTRGVVSMLLNGGLNVSILEYGLPEKAKVHLFLKHFLKLIFSNAAIYSPISRSFWGAFRDIPIYVLAILGRTLVVHIHGSDFNQLFTHRVLGSFLSYVLRKKTQIIVTNLRSKNELMEFGCTNVVCIENYFPNKYLMVKRKKKKSNTFFWNSNIIATKGIFEFLEAFVIFSNHTNATLRISGEVLGCSIMSKKDTQKRFNTFLSNSNISYVGKLTRLETLDELAITEVCVLTSYGESQPLAIIDGMCMGCTIFCSDLPELREMTNQYNRVHYTKANSVDILENLKNVTEFINTNTDFGHEFALRRFSEDLYRDKLLTTLIKK